MIAAGARSFIPDYPGHRRACRSTPATHHAHRPLPKHLIVLGGGFIAAELGHVFQALGSRVTIVNRGHRLLQAEDHDDRRSASPSWPPTGSTSRSAPTVERIVDMTADGVVVEVDVTTGERIIEGDTLLVAAGRIPNSDQLRVEAGGSRGRRRAAT